MSLEKEQTRSDQLTPALCELNANMHREQGHADSLMQSTWRKSQPVESNLELRRLAMPRCSTEPLTKSSSRQTFSQTIVRIRRGSAASPWVVFIYYFVISIRLLCQLTMSIFFSVSWRSPLRSCFFLFFHVFFPTSGFVFMLPDVSVLLVGHALFFLTW